MNTVISLINKQPKSRAHEETRTVRAVWPVPGVQSGLFIVTVAFVCQSDPFSGPFAGAGCGAPLTVVRFVWWLRVARRSTTMRHSSGRSLICCGAITSSPTRGPRLRPPLRPTTRRRIAQRHVQSHTPHRPRPQHRLETPALRHRRLRHPPQLTQFPLAPLNTNKQSNKQVSLAIPGAHLGTN